MKPWRTWLACLGLLGALAIISGCGGSDVPDPDSDTQAAAVPENAAPPQPAPAPVASAPAPAPAAVPAPVQEKPEAAQPEAVTAQAEPSPPEESPAPTAAPPSAGGNPQAADRGSATAEMLAIATKDAPAPAGGDAAPANPASPGAAPPAGPGGMPMPGAGPGMPGMMPGMPGAPGNPGPAQQAAMMKNMQDSMRNRQPGNPGMPGMPGMPGGPGGPGGLAGSVGGGSDKPPDFRSPEGAVQAFLDALKARDLDRLTEATALRAQTESSARHKEMFKRIFDSTLSESELNKLAEQLDGYRIAGENPPKSTGRVDVVLMKTVRNNNQNSGVMGGGATYRLRITARREKKGWGVCDISDATEFKNQTFTSPYRKKR